MLKDYTKIITELLVNLNVDLKAEVVIAGLIENNLLKDDWFVSLDGQFKRGFSKDLFSVDTQKFGDNRLTGFHLSRDGIYDVLPESLFHPISEKPIDNGHEMALDSKKEKKRENEIRNFFSPYEQESFFVRLLIEQKEREFLTNVAQGQLSDFFTRFWNVECSIKTSLFEKLIVYLPFSQKIVGNYDLTFDLLKTLIGEDVTYNIIRNRKSDDFIIDSDQQEGLTLGEASLSWDFVCGDTIMDLTPVIDIIIGPIQKNNISDYFKGGAMYSFIDCFCSFFLPFDMDYSQKLLTIETKEFILSDDSADTMVGYDTYI